MKENKNTEKQGRRPATPRQAKAGTANLIAYRNRVNGRPALKSGIHATIAAGEIPAEIPYASEIRKQVSELIDDGIVDLGGRDAITSTQRQILESSRLALTIVALGARYLTTEGIVDRRTRKPHGLLSVLAVYCNTVRLNAETLGLSRKAKDALTLEGVVAEYRKKENHTDE